MTDTKVNWQFRAAQLDLARQLETLDFVESFIEFIADFDFNALVLYLEGRIATKSFPYPPPEASYTPDDMKRIIEFAGAKDIEVVPVVSNLGHTEMFLQYPELAELAELRGGRMGRFGTGRGMMCPSLSEAKEFFAAYFAEIAEIFPSEYFHIGCDESWDIGFCPLCRERAEGDEGQAGIFAKHLIDTHAVVTGQLGKRIIMWDDMFECYPEALEAIPRDIVMCCWQYDSLVDMPKAHFLNRRREDLLAEYERLGFSYMIAPADGSIRNIETFTRYAARYSPLGGLVTSWEKGTSFHRQNLPNFAFAGALWSNGDLDRTDDAFADIVKRLFWIEDARFVQALRTANAIGLGGGCTAPAGFLTGPVTPTEHTREQTVRLAYDALHSFLIEASHADPRDQAIHPLGQEVLEDTTFALRRSTVQARLRRLVPELYDRLNGVSVGDPRVLAGELRDCIAEIEDFACIQKLLWQRYRPGIEPCKVASQYDGYLEQMNELLSLVESSGEGRKDTGLFTVRWFLPDAYSAQKVSLSVRYEEDDSWTPVAEGVFKSLGDTYYYKSWPVSNRRVPAAVRIESWGYGGQGLAFLEVVTPAGRYVPCAITGAQGRTDSPENVLTDDLKPCYLGEPDSALTFQNPQSAFTKHWIEIELRKE